MKQIIATRCTSLSFVTISKLRSLRLSNNNKGFTIMNKWACNSLWNRLLGWVDWFSGLANQILSGFNRRSSGRFDRFFSSSATGFNRTSESQFDRFSRVLNQILSSSGFNGMNESQFYRFSRGSGFNSLTSGGQFDRFSGSGFNRGSESQVDTFGLNRANDSQFDRFSGSGFNRGSGGGFDRFRSSSGFNRTSGGEFDRFSGRGFNRGSGCEFDRFRSSSGFNRTSGGQFDRFIRGLDIRSGHNRASVGKCKRVLDHNLGHGSRGRNRASGVYNIRSGGCNVCLELFTVAVTASTAAESTASNDN